MRCFLLVLFALSCAGLSSCLFFQCREPEVTERQPITPLLGKPLCVDRILFYYNEKCALVYEDNDDFRRVRRETKETLTDKLRQAGFTVEECEGWFGDERLHLEIGGYRRSEMFGLVNFIVARVRAYNHPVDLSDSWVFEITNLEEPITGTGEQYVRKTANALIDKIVAELKKKATATNP